MARLGLGRGWDCLFANDFDALKTATYRDNFGVDHLHPGDVWAIDAGDLPGPADLAWASSPCQDVSLAGARAGLGGARSSAFWGFWRLIEALDRAGRGPRAPGRHTHEVTRMIGRRVQPCRATRRAAASNRRRAS